MSIYDEYPLVINEAQRRVIMRALTNAMANDRPGREGGTLSRPNAGGSWLTSLVLTFSRHSTVQLKAVAERKAYSEAVARPGVSLER
jgi:hypothetical protein